MDHSCHLPDTQTKPSIACLPCHGVIRLALGEGWWHRWRGRFAGALSLSPAQGPCSAGLSACGFILNPSVLESFTLWQREDVIDLPLLLSEQASQV